MTDVFLAGFFLGLSLILAIGAQNAFVLRQGLRGQYVLPVVLTCAISDALLIAAGVAGYGGLISAAPWILTITKWGGAVFLVVYGALSFKSAFTSTEAMELDGKGSTSMQAAVATCLLLTWANPHVYLDTVILLGGISAQYSPAWIFGLGAAISSFVFFFSLGYGARLLRPLFASPKAWRFLDFGVGCTMWLIALSLIIK